MKQPKTTAKTTGARKRPGKTAAQKGQGAPRAGKTAKGPGAAGKAATPVNEGRARKARTDSKQAQLIAMLKANSGATVEEIAKVFAWQNHTVRGALYGALKKRLQLDVVSEKVEGRGRVYRIGS